MSRATTVIANDSDLAFASIEKIGALFRKKKLSPVELTKLLLACIDKLNPQLNCYLTVTPELAFAQAKQAERELSVSRGRGSRRDRGPLHGIPISLKDNICTAGIRTTAGSKILQDFIPSQNAAVAAQLFAAGAVLLGKTNLHEFAYGITTNNPHYGPARNPWDLQRIPGGSSGGSAAAVAAGLCYATIGTDTGGSIRIPSALCGIVGLKPGLARVSAQGVIPLSPLLDFVGPMARTVRDTELMLSAILQKPSAAKNSASPRGALARPGKFTLALPDAFFTEVMSPDVRAVFDQALSTLRRAGAKTTKLIVPLLKETEHAGNQIAWAEATHYHQQEGWYPSRSADYGEDVRGRLEMGRQVTATSYLEALDTRAKFIEQFHRALAGARVDALLVPTVPIVAPLIGQETIRIAEKEWPTRALLLRANRPANLAGIPAISIPCGLTVDGLPVGLQLIGVNGSESRLLAIAKAYERERGDWQRPPL
ncbi:MAG TPA: amidase [Candidatus Acidoferrum sp.]|jgi:aspartyl-tRNA(Asn)/glutamyl-tRNA(Gln) amidotransferase subunit A